MVILLDLHRFVCLPYSLQLFGNILFSLLLHHVSTAQESIECMSSHKNKLQLQHKDKNDRVNKIDHTHLPE